MGTRLALSYALGFDPPLGVAPSFVNVDVDDDAAAATADDDVGDAGKTGAAEFVRLGSCRSTRFAMICEKYTNETKQHVDSDDTHWRANLARGDDEFDAMLAVSSAASFVLRRFRLLTTTTR
jgi:hypothetical protein